MIVNIDKDGTVWTHGELPFTDGGYTHTCIAHGRTPEEALKDFWSEGMEGIPIKIVRPEILSLHRLHSYTLESGLKMYCWRVECGICGSPEWANIRSDLDPNSSDFKEWVEKYRHTVVDNRE